MDWNQHIQELSCTNEVLCISQYGATSEWIRIQIFKNIPAPIKYYAFYNMVKLKWIGINIFRNYPARLKYYVLYNMVQPLNGFKSKYIYIFSLSIASEDFWSC